VSDLSRVRYLDARDSLNLRIDGLYERFETSFVKSRLRAGACFVDVGAHIGYYSTLAASLVGADGAVFAFEPDPTNCALLRKNSSAFGDLVRVYESAVSDAVGSAWLYLSADNSGDHQLGGAEERKKVLVNVMTIDSCAALASRAIDFLKIDVQGWEVSVLRGAAKAIERSPHLCGIIEFWPRGLKRAGMSAGDFLRTLNDMGFNVYVKSTKRRLAPATYPFLKSVTEFTNLIVSKDKLI
jgi:FkbM family methyltransferase